MSKIPSDSVFDFGDLVRCTDEHDEVRRGSTGTISVITAFDDGRHRYYEVKYAGESVSIPAGGFDGHGLELVRRKSSGKRVAAWNEGTFIS